MYRTIYKCRWCDTTLIMRVWVMAHTTDKGQKIAGYWKDLTYPLAPLSGEAHDVTRCPAQGLCFQCGQAMVWRVYKAHEWQVLELPTDPRTREPHVCGVVDPERKKGGETC
jgi:hypothetical protein